MEKLYIPHFIDSSLMECRIVWEKMKDSTALQLTQVIEMIVNGCNDPSWVFQTINCKDGFVNNEYPDEITGQFEGWLMLSEGVILQFADNLNELKVKKTGLTIGYDPTAKWCICPCTKELLKQINASILKADHVLKFKVEQIEDLLYLHHLEAIDMIDMEESC